jgi:hypothetical protein
MRSSTCWRDVLLDAASLLHCQPALLSSDMLSGGKSPSLQVNLIFNVAKVIQRQVWGISCVTKLSKAIFDYKENEALTLSQVIWS